MRFFILIGTLISSIAFFPLPTTTNVNPMGGTSLHELLTEVSQCPPGESVKEPRLIVLDDAPEPLDDSSVETIVESAAPSASNATEVQDPHDQQEPDGAPDVAASTPSTPEENEHVDKLAESCPPPSKPQAVISTGFEKNGLSEASFRTVAKAAKDLQPPEEKVLVIGDSLSIPVGKHLEDYFSKIPGIYFKRLGKVSSGLARPDFFDWERTLAKLASSMHPSTVVIMIGTNDNQSLKRSDGSTTSFGNNSWDDEYTRRVNKLFELCVKNNPDVNIFWVGAPIMERPQLTHDVQRINKVIQKLCDSHSNCYFVDTWDALADEKGRFTKHMVDNSGELIRIRANDGVHLSSTGADILASRCLQSMTDSITVLQSRPRPEPSG